MIFDVLEMDGILPEVHTTRELATEPCPMKGHPESSKPLCVKVLPKCRSDRKRLSRDRFGGWEVVVCTRRWVWLRLQTLIVVVVGQVYMYRAANVGPIGSGRNGVSMTYASRQKSD